MRLRDTCAHRDSLSWPDLRALLLALALLPLLALPGCAPGADVEAPSEAPLAAAVRVDDPHSFANPGEAVVRHLTWDAAVDFETRRITGRASLEIENLTATDTLVLDTRGLDVRSVTLDDGEETTWELGEGDPFLGQPLEIRIAPDTERVHVDYATGDRADAVQWLDPAGTAGGEHPFLFTQSQAILARTWIPIQDTPGVRFTYDATVRVPPELMAVMSAENPRQRTADGVYRFSMPQAIPSYLMALAVGDLEFRPMGERTGVYAEPALAADAAWEFAETEAMMEAAEELYGPYRWGRYDILVLPPSFPFGGMENPRLTFATPTILAGDRSLVALVAHELGHSWSGNLVTNANWNDFWLNEGFTVYVERRLMEALRGREYAEMLAALGRLDLEETLDELGRDDPSTALHLALEGDDPDEGMNDVAYEKGYFFLRMLEEAVGRETWDPFLRSWFDDHAFESVTSEEFLRYLDANLLSPSGMDPASLQVETWVYGPGLPDNAPAIDPGRFAAVDAQEELWLAGRMEASALATEDWTTHEWLHFIRALPDDLTAERLALLDQAFGFTESGNSEILAAWFLHTIAADYGPAYPALEDFLTRMGRRKFLQPLYEALAATPEGRERALEIYREARPTYHPISRATIDQILDWPPAETGGGNG